jgi:hypothetical protein
MATPTLPERVRWDLASELQSPYHHCESFLQNTGMFPADCLRAKLDRYDNARQGFKKAWSLYCDTKYPKDYIGDVADANERPIHDFAESWDCEPFDEEQMVAAMYLAFGAVKALAELCGVNACTAELI